MIRLIFFELQKVWRRRSFWGILALLVFLNLFLLWFLNRPAEEEPPLSAYKAVCQDISAMTEAEKLDYLTGLKERLDGVALVEEVQTLQGWGSEMGTIMADQLLEQNPGVYEEYSTLYMEGDYLTYTASLAQELALLEELYTEITAVANYDNYLSSVQENSVQLSGISIFQSAESENSFSSRNIEKSAADHAGLTSDAIRWYPSKGLTLALESQATDLLLLLSVFLFVAQLITEEKRRGLFHITRATNRGITADMGARLLALLIHCGLVCLLLYGSNLLYGWAATGLGDLSAALQSIAPYLESSLPISLLAFLLLGLATKTGLLFCLGLVLTLFAIFASHSFVPPLAGLGFLGLNWLAYALIPSYSQFKALKHLSFFGLLRIERLYGAYLNLNLLGRPVSRLACGLAVLILFLLLGTSASLLLFRRGASLTFQRTRDLPRLPFHPHSSLFRHESYKLLAANRILLILLVFAVLIGWSDLKKTYTPSAKEQYYQSLMLSLEGRLTEEKEALLASEQARYDEALAQIEQIDSLVADGSISKDVGDNMKVQWYSQLAFYPYFQRIWVQYQRILETGGVFVYDTGYLYLFGAMDDSFFINLLLLSLCVSFAFSNVMSMEDSKGAWNLLAASRCGRAKLIGVKWLICALAAGGMTLLPWIFRWCAISTVYPMDQLLAGIQSIPQYQSFPIHIPILVFLLLAVLLQLAAVQAITAAVLLLSLWRKSDFQALFLALLLLAAPLVLAAMGLEITKWFSVWPVYSWTGIAF